MKKYFLLGIFAIGTLSLTSCKKNCCSLLTVKVCEDDFDGAVYDNWDEAKTYYQSAGWNCD